MLGDEDMSRVMPPANPPGVGYTDSDDVKRIKFRLWQIAMAAITLVVSAWFCTLGVLAAIITLLVAKHVLVAIVVAGLNMPAGPKDEVR